jgi:hypothetical protein
LPSARSLIKKETRYDYLSSYFGFERCTSIAQFSSFFLPYNIII